MNREKKSTIILVEDHSLVRQSMREFLTNAGYHVLAEVKEKALAYPTICSHQPDIVLMDFKLVEGDTFDIAAQLKRDLPQTKVIVVTGVSSATTLKQISQSKVDGLFLKEGATDELLVAIEKVLNGQRYISPLVQPYLEELTIQITPREMQILNLIVMGLRRKEIASQLNLSPETIKSHRKNIMRKLDVNNIAALIVKTESLKLLEY